MAEIQGTYNVSKSQGKAKSAKEDHWDLIQLREYVINSPAADFFSRGQQDI